MDNTTWHLEDPVAWPRRGGISHLLPPYATSQPLWSSHGVTKRHAFPTRETLGVEQRSGWLGPEATLFEVKHSWLLSAESKQVVSCTCTVLSNKH